MSDKQALRRRLLERRSAMTDRADRSRAMAARALAGLSFDGIVAGYCAMRDEADPVFLLRLLHQRGQCLSLPVVLPEKRLAFRQWKPGDPLHGNALGMEEPAPGETLIPDVILVPLLAFDQAGHRLGYGGGYYDRLLAGPGFAHVRRVGLAFACQQVGRLPSEAHDVTLDAVVTEERIHHFGAARGEP